MKKIFAIFLLVCMSSCTWITKVNITGKDHYSGWGDQVRELSVHSWKYAQLAQNVYASEDDFNMANEYTVIDDFKDAGKSYFASLYRHASDNEYVLVFRGTDSFTDFKTGNNPFQQTQNAYGIRDFDAVMNNEAYTIDRIVVVGHSLGGGITSHIALNRKATAFYTFNGSPVYRRFKFQMGQQTAPIKNKLYSIAETGEVNKYLRVFAREPNQLYTSIGCTRGNPIYQHSMKRLATCLTQIAATESKAADHSLKINHIDRKYLQN